MTVPVRPRVRVLFTVFFSYYLIFCGKRNLKSKRKRVPKSSRCLPNRTANSLKETGLLCHNFVGKKKKKNRKKYNNNWIL